MNRNNKLTLRLTDDEMKLIEEQSARLKKQKSEFVRDCALGANKAAASANAQFEILRDEVLGVKLAISDLIKFLKESRQLHDEVLEVKSAISDLVKLLNEQLRDDVSEVKSTISDLIKLIKDSRRIPSFREFRARAYAAGNEKLQHESAYDYIMRLARDYWANYGVWPRWIERDFGSAIPGYDMTKWPDKLPDKFGG